MNIKTLFFLFLFGLIGCATTSFAQSIIEDELDVYQGTVYPIQLESQFGAPQLKSDPVEGNIVELASVDGSTYGFNYIPEPSFLGSDGFSIEVIEQVFPPIKTTYVFQIEVISSMIDANNDFVHLNSLDEITIDPLSNDESSSTDLTITLAQVLKGAAVVNTDQTISYIPTDADTDFIIYSVKDEFNTVSNSTIYISQESVLTEELTVRDYEIASGNAQYIILPNDDFTLIDEPLSFGSLGQINAFVYEYKSDKNVEGDDVIRFEDSNENEYQASISIIEKYTDEGFVKDDLFFSASNTNLIFDVTLNDVVDQYVISDYSEELIHLGSGVFSYTPNPYYSGVKTFTYTADDGLIEETGTIEIVVNNFKPTNYFEYNLSTPENQPRIIEYDVPLGSEYFEILSMPDHGTIEIFTEDESVDVGCDEGVQKVFALYTPDVDFVGTDDLTLKYCASDNNLCSNVNIAFEVIANVSEDCICVDDCVWPGDANGDGKVSVVDALSIGRFIGKGGSERAPSQFGAIYEGSSSDNWNFSQVNGKNVKHADTDGDGFITAEDLEVVVDNYGSINSVISADVLGIKSLPFLLTTDQTEVDSGEVLTINVIIGSEAFPAIDIHGVAFAVNLDPGLVDSSSVIVEYIESGYLVKDAPYIELTHQPNDGIIHTAGSKTNALGSTGFGIVATVSFIVEEDAEGIREDEKKRSVTNTIGDLITSIKATDIIIEDSRGFKYALPNSSLDITVKSGEDETPKDLSQLNVSPNPSNDIVRISSADESILNSIYIYSIEGRLIKTINQIQSSEAQVEVDDFKNGIYIIKASSDNNTFTSKLIKE